MPLWVLLLEAATGIRRPPKAASIACAVGFAGLALVVGPGGGIALSWAAVLLGAAAFAASGEIGGSHVPQVGDALWATTWQLLGAGAALLIAGTLIGETADLDWQAVDRDTLWSFAFLVLVGSVLAYPALVWLLANTPTSTAATYAYVNPVVALALGAVLLGEDITLATLAGAAVVLTSVFFVIRADRRST